MTHFRVRNTHFCRDKTWTRKIKMSVYQIKTYLGRLRTQGSTDWIKNWNLRPDRSQQKFSNLGPTKAKLVRGFLPPNQVIFKIFYPEVKISFFFLENELEQGCSRVIDGQTNSWIFTPQIICSIENIPLKLCVINYES